MQRKCCYKVTKGMNVQLFIGSLCLVIELWIQKQITLSPFYEEGSLIVVACTCGEAEVGGWRV